MRGCNYTLQNTIPVIIHLISQCGIKYTSASPVKSGAQLYFDTYRSFNLKIDGTFC